MALAASGKPKDDLDAAAAAVKQHPNFNVLKQLGVGSFASVWLARDRSNSGKEVAVKVFLHGAPKYFEEDSVYEVSIMKKLPSHPHIVKLLDVHILDTSSLLVYEALEMDLKSHLRFQGEFVEPNLQDAALQILTALDFCHRQRIIHCDLSPKNVLVDQGGSTLKLADFGTAEICTRSGHPHTRDVVTLWYRAPELLLGVPAFTFAIDIWSFGCVFAEMVSARPLFPGANQIDVLFFMFRLLGTPTEVSWPGCLALPHFNLQFPRWHEGRFASDEHGAHLARVLDAAGLKVLSSALERCPAKRLSASRLLAQEFFTRRKSGRVNSHRLLGLVPTPSRKRAASRASDTAEGIAPGPKLTGTCSTFQRHHRLGRAGGCLGSVMNLFGMKLLARDAPGSF